MSNHPSAFAQVQSSPFHDAAVKPPHGVVSNFDSPANSNGLGYGMIIACMAIATLALASRLGAMAMCKKRLEVEDCEFTVVHVHFCMD